MDSAGKTVVHGSQGTERDWFLVPALQLTPCVVCFWGSRVMCCSCLARNCTLSFGDFKFSFYFAAIKNHINLPL